MSAGFRVLVLILLAGGAIWAHHFRWERLAWIFEAPRPEPRQSASTFASPLDRVLGPYEAARVLYRGQSHPPPVAAPSRREASEESPSGHGPPEPATPTDLEPPPADLDLSSEAEGPAPDGGDDSADGQAPDPAPTVARSALPAAASGGALQELRYRVGEKDTLWTIAQRFLGSGSRYGEIIEANQSLAGKEKALPVGAEIRILLPAEANEAKNLKSEAESVDTPVAADSVELSTSGESDPEPPNRRPQPEAKVLHRVRKNENLMRIAQRYFPGDSDGWQRIYSSNRELLPSPDLVRQGMVLEILIEEGRD